MKYRLYPDEEQEGVLNEHCGQVRWLWNQLLAARKDEKLRAELNSYPKMCKYLTGLRAEYDWLRDGSQTAQQQSLKDLQQTFSNHFKNPGHFGWPTWRKHGINEGFRIVGPQALRWRRLNRHWAEVNIPKVGWVRFRWSRNPGDPKSYRIKKDVKGQWWICFASIPEPIESPENDKTVGVDCGVVCSFATSAGETIQVPGLTPGEERRKLALEQKLSRQELGSKRRSQTKRQLAKVNGKAVNRKDDLIEKLTTNLAKTYEHIHIEDLDIKKMTKAEGKAKKDLNRGILGSGWGKFAQRLEDKAPGRVVRINPAYSSQCCSQCKHVAKDNRESQARFLCRACGHKDNADVNAAKVLSRGPGWATSPEKAKANKAAGHAVSARSEPSRRSSSKREPQLA